MSLTSRAVAVALAAVLSVAGLSACSSGPDAVTDVSVASSASVLAQPGITLIDVRTPTEYASGHLADAVNIDVNSDTFDSQVGQLPKDGAYFVYCHSGNRSAAATARMAKLGFTTIYNLTGGVADWQANGGALVTS
ncbi:MAG TPA: rhodanese-like domain-containing protein [Cellulomonas sp.]|uniref:rhodanese-like domain-containing protein n=1 Tax=Cellulomonas sp. TaxID=40001 RepID=UPI002E3419CB|nr:rhodanese-like domain-containing protein [Cellulomonas sp.]HEX5333122.1 rhodanese-like domain-containing protein [Cellulomonas sp.]